jgi:hypothetical protein
MEKYTLAALALGAVGVALGASSLAKQASAVGMRDPAAPSLKCTTADSSGSFACKDSGNYDSTCATAKCPAGYTLTGGGGACSAGDRKVKSLFPRLATGEFTIACEQQGVAPQANAICCKL